MTLPENIDSQLFESDFIQWTNSACMVFGRKFLESKNGQKGNLLQFSKKNGGIGTG